MTKGTEVFRVLCEMEYNDLVYQLTKLLKDECNPELILTLVSFVYEDLHVLTDCNDEDELRSKVLSKAKLVGHYAGLEYVADELLDVDDEDFQDSDGGLAWIPFTDMWATLIEVAELNNTFPK